VKEEVSGETEKEGGNEEKKKIIKKKLGNNI
jgi:hypothetical protein